MLIRVANIRAGLALERQIDIFQELLPVKTFGRSTKKVLLDTTRHTPRDFLQLLKYIQSACAGPKANPHNLRTGIRKYSTDYFLPEMLDELDGYIEAVKAKEFFRLVAMFRARDFWARDTYALAVREGANLTKDEINTILKALFECSAIGNVEVRERGLRFFTFRFRNRHAAFNLKGQLFLHRGLWYALNLPVDPTWDSDELAEAPESPRDDTQSVRTSESLRTRQVRSGYLRLRKPPSRST